MITDTANGLHATQYKSIDGLQIRYATNDKEDGEPILLLSPLPESILAFLPPGRCSQHSARSSPLIFHPSAAPRSARTDEHRRLSVSSFSASWMLSV